MNKIFRYFIATIVTIFIGCDNNNDLGYNPSPEIGWIQFLENQPDVIMTNKYDNETISLSVNVQVPTTSTDLRINYDMVSVSGLDPNSVFSNTGFIVTPAGQTSYQGPDNNTGIQYAYLPTIEFDVSEITTNLSEPMVFDVVLKSTSSSDITVGLDGVDFPTTQRISICPSYDSASGNFLGDYQVSVPTGNNPLGLAPFQEGAIVSIIEGSQGALSRSFMIDYIPAVPSGLPLITIEFNFTNNSIIIPDGIATGVGCSSAIFLGGDSNNILSVPCADNVITLNMLDFLNGSGGCGATNVPLTLVLTKVE